MSDVKITRHDDVEAFLSTAPINDSFRHFARTSKPLEKPDSDPEIVILSNGVDSAAAFSYYAGRSWQMFVEFLPSVDDKAQIAVTRAMLNMMFDDGIDSVLCLGREGDELWQSFNKAIGARCIKSFEGRDLFEITRSTH